MTEEIINENSDNDSVTEEIFPEDNSFYSDNETVEESITEEVAEVSVEVTEAADEKEALKNEIAELKKILDAKEKEQEQILRELGDFDRLFPGASISSVPDTVWKSVETGIPLCAAYALYERERSIMQNHADEINARNSSLAAGKAGKGSSEEYFSPDEVKRMSQKEVHKHFSKIKNSMKYWH